MHPFRTADGGANRAWADITLRMREPADRQGRAQAQLTTINAHYTSPDVVAA